MEQDSHSGKGRAGKRCVVGGQAANDGRAVQCRGGALQCRGGGNEHQAAIASRSRAVQSWRGARPVAPCSCGAAPLGRGAKHGNGSALWSCVGASYFLVGGCCCCSAGYWLPCLCCSCRSYVYCCSWCSFCSCCSWCSDCVGCCCRSYIGSTIHYIT